MRRLLSLTVLLTSLFLGACGTRGPLTLPPPQSKTLSSVAEASEQPLAVSIDLNTAKELS